MRPIIGPNEQGLTYCLDLQEGSTLHTPTPTRAARQLPICICSYGYFVAGPGHFTERNICRSLYQIFITHRGCGRFTSEGREYFSTPGTAVLLDFNQPHRYEAFGGVWEHEWVNFSGSACRTYMGLINPEGPCVHGLGSDPEPAAILGEIGRGVMQQDMPGFVRTTTRIIRLLDCLYSLSVTLQRSRIDDLQGNIQRCISFIQSHYMQRLNLDEIAQMSYLSKYYFSRAFRQYMGITPYEYLTSVRLSHAKNLLISTQLSVDEIGYQTGFGGAKNFIRQFRQSMGMTPGEYRKTPGA